MERMSSEPELVREDRELVTRLRAGDEAAFSELFDAYFQGVFRFALTRVAGDRELAGELAQAAFCKAFERLETYRGEGPIFGWLCAICRFEISGHFRRLGRRPPEAELPEEGIAASGGPQGRSFELGDPQDRALRSEVARLVHVTLDGLPAHHRQVLRWKYVDGLGVREIAARMALSFKAAESLLTRARQGFRDGYGRIATGVQTAAVAEEAR